MTTVGLCERCVHCKRIASDRGSTFYLCGRAATDQRYPKYPRLPVLTCPGYEPANEDRAPDPRGEN